MTRASLFVILAPLALAAGCNVVELGDVPCPPGGTQLTYENFGKGFFSANCDYCHSAENGERRGAPDNYVFDTRDQIRHHRERIFARSASTNDSMPPGPDDPPIEERDDLAEWLACGAP